MKCDKIIAYHKGFSSSILYREIKMWGLMRQILGMYLGWDVCIPCRNQYGLCTNKQGNRRYNTLFVPIIPSQMRTSQKPGESHNCIVLEWIFHIHKPHNLDHRNKKLALTPRFGQHWLGHMVCTCREEDQPTKEWDDMVLSFFLIKCFLYNSLIKGSSGESTHFLKTPLWVVECPNQLKLLPILYPETLVEKIHDFLGYGGRKVDFFDSRSGD